MKTQSITPKKSAPKKPRKTANPAPAKQSTAEASQMRLTLVEAQRKIALRRSIERQKRLQALLEAGGSRVYDEFGIFSNDGENSPRYTFVLPLPPNMGNSRRNWKVNLSVKKKYWASLDELEMRSGIWNEFEGRNSLKRVWGLAWMVVGGRMDAEGAKFRTKWTLDWIVNRKFLKDDNTEVLEWLDDPLQIVTRSWEYRVVLEFFVR